MTRPVRITTIRRPGAGVAIDREKLVRMREVRLLSRAQLAAKMSAGDDDFSITPDAIAKIENGYRRPKPVTLGRLCSVLGCEPGELLLDLPVPAAAPTPVRVPVPVPCPDCQAPNPAVFGHEPGCPHAT